MTNELNYKGYKGSSEYSEEDGVWFGKILCIKDLIMYEAEEQEGLYDSFKQAVDEYFEDCKRRGCEPDKPCSGTFNVRVGADMHLAGFARYPQAYIHERSGQAGLCGSTPGRQKDERSIFWCRWFSNMGV